MRQIIFKILNSSNFNIKRIKEYLYCNEYPIKKIIKLIDDQQKEKLNYLNSDFYKYIELISENRVGGTLTEMKKIIKFLLRILFKDYYDIPEFDPSSLQFRNKYLLFKQLEKIRAELDKLYRRENNSIEEDIKLHHIISLFWKIQFPLLRDIPNHATRSRDQ